MIFFIIKAHIELYDPLCCFYFNWEIIVNHLKCDIIWHISPFSYTFESQTNDVLSVTNIHYTNTYAYIIV